jgi:hypothetical protein
VHIILQDFKNSEDNLRAEFEEMGEVHLSGVPQRDILTKENTLNPGPWNSKPHRTHKTAVPLSRPQEPSFECENLFICLCLLQKLIIIVVTVLQNSLKHL